MNLVYLLIELVLCYLAITYLYKKYQYNGLYSYATIAFIISNIMSLKIIDLFGFTINLGLIPFVSVFIASNIIIQKRGKEEIKKLIINILLTSTLAYIILILVSKMDSSLVKLFSNKSFDNIFIDSIRLYFANIVTMLYMLFFNSNLYYYIKKEKNKIWISNIVSIIIIQFFATIIFILLAYAITTDMLKMIEMMLIRYMSSIVIGVLGTIIIYINNTKEK